MTSDMHNKAAAVHTCELVRANLVSNVTVGGNTVGADDNKINLALLHQQARGAVNDKVHGHT